MTYEHAAEKIAYIYSVVEANTTYMIEPEDIPDIAEQITEELTEGVDGGAFEKLYDVLAAYASYSEVRDAVPFEDFKKLAISLAHMMRPIDGSCFYYCK